jgi:hypothetical protein
MTSRWWPSILAVIYLLLTVAFTFPLVQSLSDHTPAADHSGDQYQTIWFFWWMKKALLSLHNPYWTNDIYFPHGTGLAHHLSPATNVFAWLVSLVTTAPINSPLVFNLLLLSTFAICGLGAYVLIREISGSELAAFLGSVFITFSPYRLWNLNHLNLLSLGWGILAFYFFIRALKTARIQDAVKSVASFTILFYASLSDALFVAVLISVYCLLSWREIMYHSSRSRLLRIIGLGIALSGIAMLPGLWQLRVTGSAWNQNWSDLITYSLDLQCTVVPPANTTTLSQWIGSAHPWDSGHAPDAFLGWTLLVMVMATLLTWRTGRIRIRWLVLAFVFLILSMGPGLRIGDNVYANGYMPYRFLFESMPYLNLSRTPIRFSVLTQLCLVVFASQGLAVWCQSLSRFWSSKFTRLGTAALASGVVLILLWIEYRPHRIELWPMDVPGVYRTVAANSSITAVLDLPARDAGPAQNRYMYWQTFYDHKSVNGYLTHASPGATTLLDRIKTWDEVDRQRADELKSLGVNAIVIRDPNVLGQEPRLVIIP